MSPVLRIALVLGAWNLTAAAFAQEESSGLPLEDITHEMKVSATQLSKRVTAKPTQEPQQEAVNKLDALIARLEEERRRRQGRGRTTARPDSPAMASTIISGPGGMGDLRSARDDGKRWGELPAHERDRILQSLTEGFPPHYQAILEAYYKRLAVEKPAEVSELPLSTPEMKSDKNQTKAAMSKPPAQPTKGEK